MYNREFQSRTSSVFFRSVMWSLLVEAFTLSVVYAMTVLFTDCLWPFFVYIPGLSVKVLALAWFMVFGGASRTNVMEIHGTRVSEFKIVRAVSPRPSLAAWFAATIVDKYVARLPTMVASPLIAYLCSRNAGAAAGDGHRQRAAALVLFSLAAPVLLFAQSHLLVRRVYSMGVCGAVRDVVDDHIRRGERRRERDGRRMVDILGGESPGRDRADRPPAREPAAV